MENKTSNTFLIIGLVVNLLLIGFFGYMYYSTTPQESDLKPVADVAKPQVYNDILGQELNTLNKVKNLPINIDPNEIGKQNPYNF